MKSSYHYQNERVRVGRKSMNDYLIRTSVDKHMETKLEEHKAAIWKEMMQYAAAVDATLLLSLHKTGEVIFFKPDGQEVIDGRA